VVTMVGSPVRSPGIRIKLLALRHVGLPHARSILVSLAVAGIVVTVATPTAVGIVVAVRVVPVVALIASISVIGIAITASPSTVSIGALVSPAVIVTVPVPVAISVVIPVVIPVMIPLGFVLTIFVVVVVPVIIARLRQRQSAEQHRNRNRECRCSYSSIHEIPPIRGFRGLCDPSGLSRFEAHPGRHITLGLCTVWMRGSCRFAACSDCKELWLNLKRTLSAIQRKTFSQDDGHTLVYKLHIRGLGRKINSN
jgi:hypothetical protein